MKKRAEELDLVKRRAEKVGMTMKAYLLYLAKNSEVELSIG
jgi:hypothetical protein